MSKLPRVSGEDVVKALSRFNFKIENWKGSHITLVNHNQRPALRLIVPNHQELRPGTLSHIVNESGVGREQFLKAIGAS